MKKQITEETVLLISVIKWSVLATVVGVLSGLATAVFILSLNWSTSHLGRLSHFYLLLPVAFFASAFITKYLAPEAEGHGTEKVIEAIHRRAAKIKAAVVPVKICTTIITLAAGGSAGKEGPCAQIGG
ncbi:MAG TPA: voltage-gated chloride channel, partial [Nitrospirae bacterium]|nr:voltage-gated chloride channel [Nitrospirota bacterium]